jgi:KDO2-lipid IV(A) lauroyltransferase
MTREDPFAVFPIKLAMYLLAPFPDAVGMVLARIANVFFYPGVRRNRWKFIRTAKVIPKIFPDKSEAWRRRVIKENALHVAKLAFETLRTRFVGKRRINRKCYIREGKARLDALLRSGEGFFILTGHLGNFEYAAAFIAMNYRRLYTPVAVSNTPGSRLMNWAREGHNIELLESSVKRGKSARTLMKIIKLIRQGEIVYLVADQRGEGGDIEGEIFGKKLKLFGGPFITGKRTGKPCLPMYSLRDERNRIAVHFEEPFYLKGDDLQEDVRKVSAFFERIMREHPEQYLWARDLW